MRLKPNYLLVSGLLIMFSNQASAEQIGFSIGGGYPFVVVPEISIASQENHQRWYANYKAGLDSGFSLGFEHSVSKNNKHALGAFIGAIGIHEEDSPCSEQAQVVDCLIDSLFDEEVTNGLGLSYAYYFNTINDSGWHLTLEAGYGEGTESKEKRSDASFRISYQF